MYISQIIIYSTVGCVRYEYGLERFLLRRIGQWFITSFHHVCCDDSISRRMGPLSQPSPSCPAIVWKCGDSQRYPFYQCSVEIYHGFIYTHIIFYSKKNMNFWDLRGEHQFSCDRSVCFPSRATDESANSAEFMRGTNLPYRNATMKYSLMR